MAQYFNADDADQSSSRLRYAVDETPSEWQREGSMSLKVCSSGEYATMRSGEAYHRTWVRRRWADFRDHTVSNNIRCCVRC